MQLAQITDKNHRIQTSFETGRALAELVDHLVADYCVPELLASDEETHLHSM